MHTPHFTIRPAQKSDAPCIAEGIMIALGDDMVDELANGHGLRAVHEIFTRLAETEDSQYSYRNSFIAVTSDGNTAGMVVAYDGAILLEARRLFFALTPQYLGWDIRDIVPDGEPDPETDPSEYYLDSLAVWPQYRGKGVATALINKVKKEAERVGKPVGLLCAIHNDKARRLYERLGFKAIGQRPFAGEQMTHMLCPSA